MHMLLTYQKTIKVHVPDELVDSQGKASMQYLQQLIPSNARFLTCVKLEKEKNKETT